MKKTKTRSRATNGAAAPVVPLSRLYEQDEVAWLEQSASLIRQGQLSRLDVAHLAEYLEDMAKSERREVRSRLVVLLAHLLKWQYQPQKRTGSWEATVIHQRTELEGFLDSATLKNHALAILPEAYAKAVKEAVAETRLKKSAFPENCPYSIDFLLSDQFPESDVVD